MIICNPVDKCTGCGLCLNSCPKNAISFKKDKEGFYIQKLILSYVLNVINV